MQGLKLGRRKGHDPARDIAEWNKLKGMSNKSGKGAPLHSTTMHVWHITKFCSCTMYQVSRHPVQC